MKYHTIIIGGGIVGLSTAYQLVKENPDISICVIEKEDQLAQHQSLNNSGVMHSGIYYKPGSLRAKNCFEGHQMMQVFCEENEVDYELCGKIIVATNQQEVETLHKIYDKGQKNGLEGLEILNFEQAREIEPYVDCVKAINVPSAGITAFGRVALKYGELFKALGGQVQLSQKVVDIRESESSIKVVCENDEYECDYLITCAGLYADRLTKMTIPDCPYHVLPFRGEYFELKKDKEYLVNHLIYPVPNEDFPFLGVHFTRSIDGGIEAGPNAVLAFKREGYHHNQVNRDELWAVLKYPGFQKLARRYWRVGLQEMVRSYSKPYFVKAMQKLIPSIREEDVERGRSGVRAMVCAPSGELVDDFLFLETKRVINVLNAPSPAATASLAIGKEILKKWHQKVT